MLLFQIFDQSSDFYDLFRVKSDCRFIQDNNFRISHDCFCQPHSLAVTFGQVLDQSVSHIRNLYHIHDFFYHVRFFVLWDFFEISHKFHVFQNGHVEIERRLFRQITDTFLCFLRLFQNIVSVYSDSSFRGCNVSCYHVHRSGFTRTVRAEESIDFALLYCERKVVNRCMITISFDQIIYFNQCVLLLL